MVEWQCHTVDELVDAGVLERPIDGNHGEIHPKGDDFVPSGIPFIMASDLKDGEVDTRGCTFIREEQANTLRKGFAKAGDVLLSHKATIGRTAIVGNIETEFVMLTPQVTYYRVRDGDRLDNRFLKYYFDSRDFQDVFNAWAGAGSTRAYLGIKNQGKLPIRFPSIDQQRVIAGTLGALDDKIALNRRINEILEALAKATFKDWFVDFGPTRAKAEGREAYLAAEIWSLFPDALDDEDRPVDWKAGALSGVADSPRRGVKPSEVSPETPYIGLEHMPRRSIALTEWEGAGKVTSTKSRFETGEILFGKLRPYFHKVGVAPTDGICSTDIVVIVPKSESWAAYVLACVSSDEFVGYTDRTSTGTKMPRTSWKTMARYEMCLPPENLVIAFQETVGPVVEGILGNIEESRALAGMRDLLLPKLLSGEVGFKEAEKAVEAVA